MCDLGKTAAAKLRPAQAFHIARKAGWDRADWHLVVAKPPPDRMQVESRAAATVLAIETGQCIAGGQHLRFGQCLGDDPAKAEYPREIAGFCDEGARIVEPDQRNAIRYILFVRHHPPVRQAL